MSDRWESFPCTIGHSPGFISFDLGVREEFEKLAHGHLACYRVSLQAPDERGLPHGDEFARLNAIEDALVAAMRGDGIQVGRVTAGGFRYFHFYTSLAEAAAGTLARRMGAEHGYDIALRYEHDPERRVYRDELFPTEDDWQVIQDMRVQESLRSQGDDLTQPREIQHWAFFASGEDRDRFVAAAGGGFAGIECYTSPGATPGEFAVTLRHVGLPDYRSMNAYTLRLNRAAIEANGNYDGWETVVCRSG